MNKQGLLKLKFKEKHKQVLKRAGVSVVYLFGSYSSGAAHAGSDIDIGVVFSNPDRYRGKTLRIYSRLYDIITDILPKDYLMKRLRRNEHEVDIVLLQFAPIGVQLNAAGSGAVLYKRSDADESGYRETVSRRHADLSYLINLRHKAVLARI
jgi:predicted nucleotidyltransferase